MEASQTGAFGKLNAFSVATTGGFGLGHPFATSELIIRHTPPATVFVPAPDWPGRDFPLKGGPALGSASVRPIFPVIPGTELGRWTLRHELHS